MSMVRILSFFLFTFLTTTAFAADKYEGPEGKIPVGKQYSSWDEAMKELGMAPKKPSCIDALTELHFTQRLADLNDVRIEQVLRPYLKNLPEQMIEPLIGEVIHLTDLNPEVLAFFLDFLRGVKAEDGRILHAPLAPEEFIGLVHTLSTQNFDSTLILHAYNLVRKDPGVFYQNMLDNTFNQLRLRPIVKKTIN